MTTESLTAFESALREVQSVAAFENDVVLRYRLAQAFGPSTEPAPIVTHGIRQSYYKGCRCAACSEVGRAYSRRMNEAYRAGKRASAL